MVLWDPTRLVDAAPSVAGVAVVVEVAELVAVPAQVESLATLSVVATLAAPVACVELDAWAFGPGDVEDVAAFLDFLRGHNVGGGRVESDLRGEALIGVGLG